MKKHLEQGISTSCWNKATVEEMLFVMLGRDPAAPVAIRAWCAERVRIGKNTWSDKQITEALECAYDMEREYRYAQERVKK